MELLGDAQVEVNPDRAEEPILPASRPKWRKERPPVLDSIFPSTEPKRTDVTTSTTTEDLGKSFERLPAAPVWASPAEQPPQAPELSSLRTQKGPSGDDGLSMRRILEPRGVRSFKWRPGVSGRSVKSCYLNLVPYRFKKTY